jgi:hypothetical protein
MPRVLLIAIALLQHAITVLLDFMTHPMDA